MLLVIDGLVFDFLGRVKSRFSGWCLMVICKLMLKFLILDILIVFLLEFYYRIEKLCYKKWFLVMYL